MIISTALNHMNDLCYQVASTAFARRSCCDCVLVRIAMQLRQICLGRLEDMENSRLFQHSEDVNEDSLFE